MTSRFPLKVLLPLALGVILSIAILVFAEIRLPAPRACQPPRHRRARDRGASSTISWRWSLMPRRGSVAFSSPAMPPISRRTRRGAQEARRDTCRPARRRHRGRHAAAARPHVEAVQPRRPQVQRARSDAGAQREERTRSRIPADRYRHRQANDGRHPHRGGRDDGRPAHFDRSRRIALAPGHRVRARRHGGDDRLHRGFADDRLGARATRDRAARGNAAERRSRRRRSSRPPSRSARPSSPNSSTMSRPSAKRRSRALRATSTTSWAASSSARRWTSPGRPSI